MDHIDREILFALQENARISMTELGKKVGLTGPAATERVKKLEEKQVIKAYRTVLNADKINKQLTAFILFDTKNGEGFTQLCKEHPDVVECHRLAGQYSYIIKLVTESVHTLERFIDDAMPFGQSSTLITLSSAVEFKSIM
jgi:Lrp/AsnC family leucine-responsive transcriptional regulator